MAKDYIKRQYEGHSDDEIFSRVDAQLSPYCESLSLKKEIDENAKTMHLHRTGFNGDVNIKDGVVEVDLQYSMLIPGAIRKKAKEKIEYSLDNLFNTDQA